MSKKSFSIITDLGPLSEVQRIQYLRDVSEHIGLDPDKHTLGTVWMGDESGLKTLVAYVRRADAEILRGIHGINVLSNTPMVLDEVIIFTAIGTDKTGRQETATGSFNLAGLKGERKAYGAMTAATRALRRLTLQFVGAGLLDESEVSAQTVDINASGSSLAQLAGSPTVIPPVPTQPNPQPGKDITEPTPEQRAAQETLANMTQKAETPKTPRKRRKVNTVELQTPEQMEMPVGQIDKKGEITPLVHLLPVLPTKEQAEAIVSGLKTEQPFIQTSAPTAPSPVPPATVPVAEPKPPQVVQPVVASISPEKKAEYTARMNKYTWEVLPSGGMTNSEDLGISAKLRNFALKLVGATGKQLSTEEQYVEVLDFLDGYLATKGAQALVSYIEQSIQ